MPRYYIAYVSPAATIEPTKEEYVQALNSTNDCFTQYMADYYANSSTIHFIRLEYILNITKFGAGISEATYNIYMEVLSVALYTPNSFPPTPSEHLTV